MFLLIYRLISGYMYIRVISDMPEKFLNRCAANGIDFWGVIIKGNRLYLKMGIQQFRLLKKLKKRCGNVHIVKKNGLPFFINRNRHRYGMPVGAVLFFSILFFMSGFAWNVCIIGNDVIPTESIINSLEQTGIYEGVRSDTVNPEEDRNDLLLNDKRLSWASINVEGCKLTVNVIEKRIKNETDEIPSNLKAKCAGIIKKVEIISGTAAVKPGETVVEGQLLASGTVEYSDLTTKFVRARGRVTADTIREYDLEQPLSVTESLRTGRKEVRSVLNFFGLNIPLYSGKVFYNFESETDFSVNSGQNNYLPIRINTKNFYEIKNISYNITEETAKKRLEAKLQKQIERDVSGGNPSSVKKAFSSNGNKILMHAEVRCEENIVYEEKIVIDTGNR